MDNSLLNHLQGNPLCIPYESPLDVSYMSKPAKYRPYCKGPLGRDACGECSPAASYQKIV
jgi:hypothetical protein